MGRVVGLFVGTVPGDPMTSVAEVTAVAGKGLDGDRYAEGRGTFSSTAGTGRQVTLIESEAVAAAGREYGVAVDPSQTRRNVVTADVPLNHLVGREFTVGDVRLRGVRLAEPCAHMAALAGDAEVRKALVHRGGLRADILSDGMIRVGDEVRTG